jgi:hypothetical protein
MDDGALDPNRPDPAVTRPELPPTGRISRRAALGGLIALAWEARALAQTPPAQTPPGPTPPGAGGTMSAADALAARGAPTAPDWPREVKTGETTIEFYLPQLDSWDGHRLEAHSAVSIQTSAKTPPVFGVAVYAADTQVDKGARQVTLENVRIEKVTFPSAKSQEGAYQKLLQQSIPAKVRTLELDRLETALSMGEQKEKGESRPLRNDPPKIVLSTTPAILVLIDGAPKYGPVQGSTYVRVVNTRPLLLKDPSGAHFVRLFDGWLTGPAVTGPWTVARTVPGGDLDKLMQSLSKTQSIDLLDFVDPNDPKSRPTLAKGPIPTIVVATEPTELVVTQGEPNYSPIDGTQLLYASNTTGHVFKHIGDQRTYVLVAGRWFRADTLVGPWTFVPGKDLPPDFAKIPDESPKENVKASVPGTPQAGEAVIANSLPETAAIKISGAKLPAPKYDGPPQLKPIEGTPLFYVVNSPLPVIQVSPDQYYALQNGVWFVAVSPQGPWKVATTVPPVIYSIPPSSSLHYVTYVYVYRATPQVVYVGYTPGYYSVYVSDGVVVYGTGYTYTSWDGTVWYGTPVTYGFATAPTYTPWMGWIMGFGFGLAFGAVTAGWAWGCYPWWGPYHYGGYASYGRAVGPYGAAAWGPGGWAATTGNVYRRWGDTAAVTRHSAGYNAWTGNAWAGGAGMSYNSRTGTVAAGQRGVASNAYTGNYAYGGRGAAVNPRTGQAVSGGRVTAGNVYSGQAGSAGYVRGQSGGVARVGNDVYATRDGTVYRNTGGGWQQNSGGGWGNVNEPARTQSLNTQQQIRSNAQTRVNNYQSAGGARMGGGGFRGGGGRRR